MDKFTIEMFPAALPQLRFHLSFVPRPLYITGVE